MKICIIGTGYVGLVTGVCLAEIGHDVICADKDAEKIKMLLTGSIPIYEPGLDHLVTKNLKSKNLHFTADTGKAIRSQDIIFICVGTPPMPDGSADFSGVEDAAKNIGRNLNGYKVIINKSTVPIGSGEQVSLIINKNRQDPAKTGNSGNKGEYNGPDPFDIVSNPEFLREGNAIADTFFPDRIVLGGSSKKAIEILKKLYEPIINQKFEIDSIKFEPKNLKTVSVLETDIISAEMIKYAANAFLAAKISFINEIANICEKTGADIKNVAQGIGLDTRIGAKFLDAGIGWGGSCFPKDVSALVKIASKNEVDTPLLNSVIDVNNTQRVKIVDKVIKTLGNVKDKTAGILGISFKPDTDDVRDAPAITIMNKLVGLGMKVKAYDPIVKTRPLSLDQNVKLCSNIEDIFSGSEIVILTTEWKEFADIDFRSCGSLMADRNFIDGRNFLDKTAMLEMGYRYMGIGR